jgi:hypothetical protein
MYAKQNATDHKKSLSELQYLFQGLNKIDNLLAFEEILFADS